jgi:toxin YoeB
MEVRFTPKAQKDLEFWKKSGQKLIQQKIELIIKDIVLHPKTGLGKPEELKYNWSGCWSRRVNKEHRIIYEIDEDNIVIHSLYGHY